MQHRSTMPSDGQGRARRTPAIWPGRARATLRWSISDPVKSGMVKPAPGSRGRDTHRLHAVSICIDAITYQRSKPAIGREAQRVTRRSQGRAQAVGGVIEALAGWQVLVAQFNDLVARTTRGVADRDAVPLRPGAVRAGHAGRDRQAGEPHQRRDDAHAGPPVRGGLHHPHARIRDDRRKMVIAPAGDGIERVAALYAPLNGELASLLTGFRRRHPRGAWPRSHAMPRTSPRDGSRRCDAVRLPQAVPAVRP